MKYILGAGIAGLIYGYYNTEFSLISPEIGGQMKSNFNLGPRYLHDTVCSRRLLCDLSFEFEEDEIKIGYIDDSGWIAPDIEFRKKYYMKSRNLTSSEGFDDSVMNSNVSSFNILKIDFNKLIEVLKEKIGDERFINDSVKSIDYVKNVLETNSGKEYSFDKVVSTIPIKFINSLIKPKGFDINFDSYDMTYVYAHSFEDAQDFNFMKYDYVYDVRSDVPWHRVSKENDGWVFDVFGEVKKENLSDLEGDGNNIIDVKTLKNSQIISTDKVHNLKDVEFIGRYGAWNRKWKTELIIEKALNEKK